ncbi:unnamed protein product [Rangifer tarandus platyrhynchus]|uniref:Uncharacterized protein n=2 Tax=Rangifer tarandus platyrhynchus TaxID=3082113 RepID=A0ABN8Z581_RANTA|nr:unnamed protein product [Rangifer tarandus platyrhynchus]CAI9704016.1 unnamed protein product [Rangifer tarandus platyrhynchus]
MLSEAAGLPGVRDAEGAAAGQEDARGSCGRRRRGHRAWGDWEQKLQRLRVRAGGVGRDHRQTATQQGPRREAGSTADRRPLALCPELQSKQHRRLPQLSQDNGYDNETRNR